MKQRRDRAHNDNGFSLLELSVGLFIVFLITTFVGTGVLRILAAQHLLWNRNLLLWNLRFAQTKAYQQDAFTMVRLYPYSPVYDVMSQWEVLHEYQFTNGINYKDGYLQMGTGRISYGVNGDSHIGGTIRLTDGMSDELDIILYLGSGLAVKGEQGYEPD